MEYDKVWGGGEGWDLTDGGRGQHICHCSDCTPYTGGVRASFIDLILICNYNKIY